MENKQIKQLSRTAFKEYEAKLEYMKNTRRLEVAQHIKEARAFGDISENAEYDAAKNEQAEVEERIFKLEDMIKKDEQSALEAEIAQIEELLLHVEVIDESSIDLSTVNVGTRIVLQSLRTGETEEYDVVSTTEAEPFRKSFMVKCDGSETNRNLGYTAGEEIFYEAPPRLSNDSPVGHAILGHKAGDVVDVVAPAGILQYKVISIGKKPDAPTGAYTQESIVS